MERDDRPLGEEVLDLGGLDDAATPGPGNGEQKLAGSGGRPSRRALLVGGGLVVVAGAVLNAVSRGSATPPTPPTPPSASSSPSALASPSVTAQSSPPAVAITNLGRPLLGVTAGWDLFALGDNVLVRINLATGRITRSVLPPLGDGASLVPARGRLFIHVADSQQGYVVPDDRPVADMPPVLSSASALLPGPDVDHVWVQTLPTQMRLVTLDGKPAGLDLTFPPYLGPGFPDGSGHVLFGDVGGFYRGDQEGLRRVTPGRLVAVGPTGLVSVECDDRAHCDAVMHTNDGRTRAVPAMLQPGGPITGTISPDGAMAVVYAFGQAGELSATLVELDNGGRRAIKLPLTPDGVGLVWSPDGRWLFAVDALQHLKVINARTLTVADLVPGLPSIRQLAIRD